MNRKQVASDPIVPNPTDPAHVQPAGNELERAIGSQVRRYRKQLGLNVAELADRAALSSGMLSKIENGNISPSLATLRALSVALNVPVTALFRQFEEQRDATYVRAGQGLPIERRGTRAGHQYQLLGHSIHSEVSVEPYLITLREDSEVFPIFQHDGVEFIYILQGVVVYRHADMTYRLSPGDSLFFDADAPHGPEELVELPVIFLSIITNSNSS
jgi:transcriptional regulator with XRE-family HTH domain